MIYDDEMSDLNEEDSFGDSDEEDGSQNDSDFS